MRVFPTFVLVVSVSMASSEGFAKDKPALLTDSLHSATARFALERAGKGACKDSNVRNVQKCFRTSRMPPVARCRKDSIF
jgi:hypothetical protein